MGKGKGSETSVADFVGKGEERVHPKYIKNISGKNLLIFINYYFLLLKSIKKISGKKFLVKNLSFFPLWKVTEKKNP